MLQHIPSPSVIKPVARPNVEVWSGGKLIAAKPNAIQYEGYDAVSQILAGKITGHIAAMYFNVRINASTVVTPAALTDKAADLILTGDTLDTVRVPTGPAALIGTTSNYDSNSAIYVANLAVGDIGIGTHTVAIGDYVVQVGLVVVQDWDDSTSDLLYAVWQPDSPIAISSSGVLIRWPIQFVAPA